MERFISAQIHATEFERQYLDTFQQDRRMFPEEVFQILEGLFFDCDEFCADPALRRPIDLDEGQLLEACKHAHEKLHCLKVLTAEP